LLHSPLLLVWLLNSCLLLSVQNLASEPSTAVVFSSDRVYRKSIPVTGRAAAKREKISFAAYLKRILPPLCHILGLTADGIVGEYVTREVIIRL